jgi:hypothetical protein
VHPLKDGFTQTTSALIGDKVFLRGDTRRTPWDGHRVYELGNSDTPVDVNASGFAQACTSAYVKACTDKVHEELEGISGIKTAARVDALWSRGLIIRPAANAPGSEIPVSCLDETTQNNTNAQTALFLFLSQTTIQHLTSAHGSMKIARDFENALFPNGDSAPFLKSSVTDIHICSTI